MEHAPAFVIRELEAYGLDSMEARAFIALTMRGLLKASEVAEAIEVPRPSIYPVLKGLLDRGLAESTIERPMRFVALPIEEAIDKLLHEQRERVARLEERRSILESLPRPMLEEDTTSIQGFRGLAEAPDAIRRVLRDAEHVTALVAGPSALLEHLIEARGKGSLEILSSSQAGSLGPLGSTPIEAADVPTMVITERRVLLAAELDTPVLFVVESREMATGMTALVEALRGRKQ